MNSNQYYLLIILLIAYSLQYVQASDQMNLDCPFTNCLTCDTNNTICKECKSQYKFSKEEKKCIYQSQCPLGQYNNNSLGCVQCHYSCKSCFGGLSSSCATCNEGYYPTYYEVTEGYFCRTCMTNHCSKCDKLGRCEACIEGFTLSNWQCIPCEISNCDVCTYQGESQQCLTCSESFDLLKDLNSCIPKGSCILGWYKNQTGICNKCHQTCLHCEGPGNSNCLACIDGYFFDSVWCVPCDQNSCKTCKYSYNFCTSCNQGKILQGNQCVNQCSFGEFYDVIDNRCENCKKECISCTGLNTCLECTDSVFYFLNSSYQCQSRCQSGQLMNINSNEYALWLQNKFQQINITDNYCIKCDDNCEQCIGQKNHCVSCKNHLLLQGTKCVESCQDGYFEDWLEINYLGYCIACNSPCTQCNKATCFKCSQGYTLKNGLCYWENNKVDQCDNQRVWLSDICMDSCPTGTIQIDNTCQCDLSCMNCVYYLNSGDLMCTNCVNQTYNIYNGVCLEICPEDTFLYYYNQQPYCFDQCPSYLYHYINSTHKLCVYNCPYGSRRLNSTYCLDTICTNYQYYDLSQYQNDQLTGNATKNYSQYCRNCHPSCQTCLDGDENDCLSCSQGYMLQQIIGQQNKTYICTQQCSPGYQQVSLQNQQKVCQACRSECILCASGLLFYKQNFITDIKGQCLYSCPYPYISQAQSPTICSPDYKLIITNPNTFTLNGKFSWLNNIQLKINLQIDFNYLESNLFIKCYAIDYNNVQQNINLIVTKSFSEAQKYTLLFNQSYLQPGQNWLINCTANITEQTTQQIIILTDTYKVQVFDTPTGIFDVQPRQGYALTTTFNAVAYQWDIPNLDFIKLYFRFSIQYFTQINSTNPKLNSINFYTVSPNENQALLYKNFEQPLSLNVPFILPLNDNQYQDTTANITLTIFNEAFSLQAGSIVITLKKIGQRFGLSQFLTLFNNSLSQSKQQIKILARSLDYFIIPNNSNPDRTSFFDLEKSQRYIPLLLNYTYNCDPLVDCNGHGICRVKPESFYSQCICNQGYAGYSCAWQNTALQLAQDIIGQTISLIMKSLQYVAQYGQQDDNSTSQMIFQPSEIMDLLRGLSYHQDIFTYDNLNRTILSILGYYQLVKSTDKEILTDYVTCLSNLIDILRLHETTGVDPEQLQKLKGKIKDLMEQVSSSLSLVMPDGKEIELYNENIILKLVGLYYLNQNNLTHPGIYTFGFTQGQNENNKFIVEISQSIVPQNNKSDIYAQMIIWPIDFYTTMVENKKASKSYVISNVHTISFKSKNDPYIQEATIQDPYASNIYLIKFRINPLITNFEINQGLSILNSYKLQCAYWNTDTQSWSILGMQTINQTSSVIDCQSTHLTDFSLAFIGQQIIEIPKENETNKQPEIFCEPKVVASSNQIFTIINIIIFLVISHISMYIVSRIQEKQSQLSNLNNNQQGFQNNNLQNAQYQQCQQQNFQQQIQINDQQRQQQLMNQQQQQDIEKINDEPDAQNQYQQQQEKEVNLIGVELVKQHNNQNLNQQQDELHKEETASVNSNNQQNQQNQPIYQQPQFVLLPPTTNNINQAPSELDYSWQTLKQLHSFYAAFQSFKYIKRSVRVLLIFLNVAILEAIITSQMHKYDQDEQFCQKNQENENYEEDRNRTHPPKNDAYIFFIALILNQLFVLIPPLISNIFNCCFKCCTQNPEDRLGSITKYFIIVIGLIICMVSVRQDLIVMVSKASGVFVGILFGALAVEFLIIEPLFIYLVCKCRSPLILRFLYWKKMTAV